MDAFHQAAGRPAIREQWEAHRKAREDLLAGSLKTTEEWIAAINDPALGDIGPRFLASVVASGCTQRVDIYKSSCIASYVSFDLRYGFINEVVYGPAAEEDLARLYSSRVHESIHAIQKMLSAALHASPFNPNASIVVCPRDWIMLEERCEQDAYVKQALFNSLLARDLPEVRSLTTRDALSAEAFEALRAKSPDINTALSEATRIALEKNFKDDILFRHHYQDLALRNFEGGMNARKARGEHDIIFVRVEPEDIVAIGSTCGIPLFGKSSILPGFMDTSEMRDNTKEELAKLNRSLGIENEDALPTLGIVLGKLGMTRRGFVAASYSRPVDSPPPPSP